MHFKTAESRIEIMHESGTAGTKGNPSRIPGSDLIPSATPYGEYLSRGKDIPRMQNLCMICNIHIRVHTYACTYSVHI